MKTTRSASRLSLLHVQLVRNSEIYELEEKVEQHLLASDTIKGAIAAGEKERVTLAESLERLRLSKVIEALRRVNSREDFNGALDDLVRRLREISGIVVSVDGITMRNMLPLDVNNFLKELREIDNVLQSYDAAHIEIASLHQKLKRACERIRATEEKLRSLVVGNMIVNAL